MTIFDMAIFAMASFDMASFDMASFDSAMFDVPSLDMADFARAILIEGEFWNGEFWQDEFWHGEFRQLFAIKIVNSRQATRKSRQLNANSAISNLKSCQIYNLKNVTMKMSNSAINLLNLNKWNVKSGHMRFKSLFQQCSISPCKCSNSPWKMDSLAEATMKSWQKNEKKSFHFKCSILPKNSIIWCSLEYLLNSLQLILSFSTFVKFRIFWCFHRTSLFQIDLVLNLFEPFWITLNLFDPYGTSFNQFRPDWTKTNWWKVLFCLF